MHPVFAGLTMLRCDLADAADQADALARIRAYAAANPDREWIDGSGWRMEWFPGGTPSRDAAGRGDRQPARLPDQPGRARGLGELGRAGPGRDNRRYAGPGGRPHRARPRRRAAGHPARGRRAAGRRAGARPTPAEQLHGLLLAQQHLHALGITAWQDAIVGEYLGYPDPLPTYLTAARDGTLTARVEGALWWDRAPRRGTARRPARPARGRPGRAVPGGHSEDHAGRGGGELHRRDDRPLPGRLRLPDRQHAGCPTWIRPTWPSR